MHLGQIPEFVEVKIWQLSYGSCFLNLTLPLFNATAIIITLSCRVSKIAEDIMSEQDENCGNSDDIEEGAKICKMLERAAEPEIMMAGMTSEQRISFSSYQAKQKVCINN